MKRKGFAIGLFVMSLIFMTTAVASAEEKVIRWKVQGCVPAGMLFHETLERLANEIKLATNGRLIWEVSPASTFVPPFEGLQAVSVGAYQVNYGYPGQWVGKIKAAALMNSVPGGFDTKGMQMWHEYGGGKELYQEMYDQAKYNVRVFRESSTNMENFQWAKKPLRTLDDFQGIKTRMMPLMGDVLAKHGFSTAFLPAAEIMLGLQRGVLDATEYSISAFDLTLGLHEVCKYVMLPGIHQPTGSLEVLINKDAWNSLPDDLKAVVEMTIEKSRYSNTLFMEAKNMEAVDILKSKGVEYIEMDPQTVETMIQWSDEYLSELAESDPFFAQVLASQRAFAEKWYPYDKMHRMNR